MVENDRNSKFSSLSKDGSIHVTDEIINTVTHMVGAIFSLLGMVLLIVLSSSKGDPWKIAAFSIYGFSLLLLFLASTFHHGLDLSPRLNQFFRLFDYLAIYILIAGSYTPICLIINRNIWGWSTFGVVWTIAAVGITVKSIFPEIPRWVSHTLYLSMSWVGIVLMVRSISVFGLGGFTLLLGGGVFYTAGAAIYYFEKPNPIPGKFGFHEIWHLFVLSGALLHFLFMYFIVLPY